MATENADGVKMRRRTFMEMQPYMFGYGACISVFSPAASLYQLMKLNPKARVARPEAFKLCARIFPHQTFLKMAQMNASTPVKEYLNPWAAFALVGVLQGGVYGQANIFFAKQLKIGGALSYAGLLRGSLFAGCRDMISQGVPFVFSPVVRQNLIDPLYPTDEDPDGATAKAKQWASVLGCSIFATYASQGLHNCQITMQANQELGYASAFTKAWRENGIRLLYRGAEARVSLLLIVNILNELLLKPAWAQVPVEQ